MKKGSVIASSSSTFKKEDEKRGGGVDGSKEEMTVVNLSEESEGGESGEGGGGIARSRIVNAKDPYIRTRVERFVSNFMLWIFSFVYFETYKSICIFDTAVNSTYFSCIGYCLIPIIICVAI